jgi:biofilm PGA synthesis N-glycosyltransferase PgaC
MRHPGEHGRYVLVTPARDEEDFIGQTIESVSLQTLRPLRWIIVNDGSTDKTREIVESYLEKYEFIKLVNLEREGNRNFSGKAIAFSHGVAELQNLDYDFIGNLDADIWVEPDYYRCIIQHFDMDPELGIAGGIVYTKIGNSFSTVDETLDSVGGAVQLFRRTCFDAVGKYLSLECGGEDAVAEIKAKMYGWKVRKFPELKVFEQRRTGSAGSSAIRAKVREGHRFYSLGYDFLFYVLRCVYRIKNRPLIIGSIAALYGFLQSMVRRRPILLPPDVVAYLRTEQRGRLMRIAARLVRIKP